MICEYANLITAKWIYHILDNQTGPSSIELTALLQAKGEKVVFPF